jgi:hypothetical protein
VKLLSLVFRRLLPLPDSDEWTLPLPMAEYEGIMAIKASSCKMRFEYRCCAGRDGSEPGQISGCE